MINHPGMPGAAFDNEGNTSEALKQHSFFAPPQTSQIHEVYTQSASDANVAAQFFSQTAMSSGGPASRAPVAGTSQRSGAQPMYVPQGISQQTSSSSQTMAQVQIPISQCHVQQAGPTIETQQQLAINMNSFGAYQLAAMQPAVQPSNYSLPVQMSSPHVTHVPVQRETSHAVSTQARTEPHNTTGFSTAPSFASGIAPGITMSPTLSSSPFAVKKDIQDREKKLKCDLCGRSYHRNSDLQVHMRAEHTGELPFICRNENCQKAFVKKSRRDRHEKIHTGIKPHKCPKCSKAYQRKEDLKVHLRSHTLERPYSCPVCARTFKTSSHYQVHIRTHGDRVPQPFVCQYCKRAFTSRGGLNLHQTKCRNKQDATAKAMLTVNTPGSTAGTVATRSIYFPQNPIPSFITNAALYQAASADTPSMYMARLVPAQSMFTPQSTSGATPTMPAPAQLAMWQALPDQSQARIYSTLAGTMVAPQVPIQGIDHRVATSSVPTMTPNAAAQLLQWWGPTGPAGGPPRHGSASGQ
eukprot:m.59410 g.59410  ORF g.59410 m.59410 type:complete len:524 (+) comp15696_c0_seq1:385-1956(+)